MSAVAPMDTNNIEYEVDNDFAVPDVLEQVYVATHDVPTSSAVTDPTVDSDDFLDYIDMGTHQDAAPNAFSAEVPASLTSRPQVAVRPPQATFTEVSGDFLGGACPPSVLNHLIEIHAPAMRKRMAYARQLNHRGVLSAAARCLSLMPPTDDPTSHPPAKTFGKGKKKEKAPE